MHRVIWRTGSARTHWKEEFERSPDPLAVAGEKVEIKEGMGKEGEMKKDGGEKGKEEKEKELRKFSEVRAHVYTS